MQLDYYCLTCLKVVRSLGKPGEKGSGFGPDDYLPGTIYAETCFNCHPEKNQPERNSATEYPPAGTQNVV